MTGGYWWALALALLFSSAPARADAIADFYRNKTVAFVVGSTAGGSYDLYARTIVAHISRYLPGAPNVIVQTMPGASSLIAAKYVANVAPKDGTVVGVLNSAAPFQELFGVDAARFGAPSVSWLPSPAGLQALLVVMARTKVKTLADLRDHEVLMATLAPGSTPSFYTSLFNDVFKLKMRAITGHPGMPEAYVAMQVGEVDGFASTPWLSIQRNYAELLARGKIRLLLQFGPSRIAELPDVPFAEDLATTDDDRRLIEVGTAPLVLGFPYFLAAGVAPERVEALRNAMTNVMQDSAFLADAKRQKLDISPMHAAQAQKIVNDAYDAPSNIIERIRRIYGSQSK